MSEFYQVEADKVLGELETNAEQGLSRQVAANRLEQYGFKYRECEGLIEELLA